MADLERLKQALIAADAAGDVDGARTLAGAIREQMAAPAVPDGEGVVEPAGVGEQLGRQVGLAGGAVAKGVGVFGDIANTIANLAISGVNTVAGTDVKPLPMLTSEIDRSGVFPKPETTTEKVVSRIGQEVVSNAVPFGAARALTRGLVPGTAPTTAQGVARTVAEAPATDLAVGVGAGVGGATADELAPDSDVARMLAPILGGVVGGIGFNGAARSLREIAAKRRAATPPEPGYTPFYDEDGATQLGWQSPDGSRVVSLNRNSLETPEITPADINAILSSEQDLLAVAKAAGIDSVDDPRLATLRERLAGRRDIEATRPADPQSVDVDQVRANQEGVAAGDIDPAAANIPAPRQPPPEVIQQGRQVAPASEAPDAQSPPVINTGRAIDPGIQAGFEANGGKAAIEQRALPAPDAPPSRPTSMSDTEIAQAQARSAAETAPPRTTEPATPPERLVVPPERTPQTPTQVEGQRQAGEAFKAADAQRTRAQDPATLDTQPAGRPQGAETQRVMLDEDFPVQVIRTSVEKAPDGKLVHMSTVRRYDPRTGEAAADAVEYQVPTRQLTAKNYMPEPRQAQDFQERAAGPVAPERPRTPDQPVQREPEQTFRTTDPDPNTDLPGASSGPAPSDGGGRGSQPGRSPLPEQPSGPSRFRDASAAEQEFRAREGARAKAANDPGRDSGQRARAEAEAAYKGAKTSNTPSGQDGEGRWHVDQFGFVKSDKGAPVKFGDQKQAARWIVGEGHKRSPDQIFEIENHPSGNGFTVRERGRSEPPKGAADPEPPQGGRGGQGAETPRAAGTGDTGSGRRDAASREAPRALTRETPETKPAPRADDAPKTADAPARPEPDAPANDAAPEAEAIKHFGSGSATFYSNPFGDPKAWAAVGKMIGKSGDWLLGNAKDSVGQLANISKKGEGAPKGGILDTPRLVARSLLASNDGRLRSLARKTGIPEFEKIADLIQPTSTSGREAVGRGYQEAFHSRVRSRHNELADALGPLANDQAAMTQISRMVRSGNTAGSPPMHKAAAAVERMLKEELVYRREGGVETTQAKTYFPRMIDSLEVVKSADKFKAAVTSEYRKTGLSPADAKAAAEDLVEGILSGRAGADALDFRHHSDAIKSEKARVFGASADKTLEPWLVNDPGQALMRYISSTTKRVELAKRFGAKGEKMNEMIATIIEKGGRDFAHEAITAYQGGTGQIRPDRVNGRVQNLLGWVRVQQTVGLLEKAMISSMGDLISPVVRSGKLTDLPKVLGRYVQQMAGYGIQARERAEVMGLIGKAYEGSMMLARAGTEPQSQLQSLITSKFFIANLLEQHTQSARIANNGLVEMELRTYARDVAEQRRGKGIAARRLEELGIPRDQQEAFAAWLADEGGAPSKAALKEDKGFAAMYRTAAIRGANMGVPDPNAALKPYYAGHPVGGLVFHLQSFNYAWTKQLYRVAQEAYASATGKNWKGGDAGLTAPERLALLGPAAALPLMFAVGYGMSAARDEVFDAIGEILTGTQAQTRREKSAVEKVIEGGSRAGLFGALDPFVNAAASTRYGKDPLVALMGPTAGTISSTVRTALAKDSERTNTKERNLAGTAYSLFVEPAVNAGVSMFSSSPALSFALMAGVSGNPAIKNGVQTYFAGPETLKTQGGGAGSERMRAPSRLSDPGSKRTR